MRRVMIIGCSGSGKSTLARRLAAKTKLPVIHIDKFYWAEGWVMRPSAETQGMIAEAIKAPEWIIEGNNSSTFHLRARLIDTLIVLDMLMPLCLFRVFWRAFKGRGTVGEDMAPGCPERFDWNLSVLVKLIWGYKNDGRLKAVNLMREVPDNVAVHELTNTREVESFLAGV
jgi:adenylate kinase family enzyme